MRAFLGIKRPIKKTSNAAIRPLVCINKLRERVIAPSPRKRLLQFDSVELKRISCVRSIKITPKPLK